MSMNPVVHFEMPADDSKRMSEFYTKAFGWKMQNMGAEMGSYIVATTTEVDEATNRPKVAGAINGGFFQRSPENSEITMVISVDDINDGMERVKQAGGSIKGQPTDIPGIGKYVAFIDSEGNRVAMLQPNPTM